MWYRKSSFDTFLILAFMVFSSVGIDRHIDLTETNCYLSMLPQATRCGGFFEWRIKAFKLEIGEGDKKIHKRNKRDCIFDPWDWFWIEDVIELVL